MDVYASLGTMLVCHYGLLDCRPWLDPTTVHHFEIIGTRDHYSIPSETEG